MGMYSNVFLKLIVGVTFPIFSTKKQHKNNTNMIPGPRRSILVSMSKMNQQELNTELRRLFNRLFELHESRQITDEHTAITLAMLDHDMHVQEQLTASVKEMKEYIDYGTTHGIPMTANYVTMYELFAKKMDNV